MIKTVQKGTVRLKVGNAHHLAAFLNNGWEEVAETAPEPKEESVTYTKTEINRMSKADLISLATLMAIDGAENMNAVGLKEALIQHFGL